MGEILHSASILLLSMVDLLGNDRVAEEGVSMIFAEVIFCTERGLGFGTVQCSGKVRSSHLIA